MATHYLELADWRRRVAALYAEVRRRARAEPAAAWADFVAGRNELLRTHPQTPLRVDQQGQFRALAVYPYDPAYCLTGRLDYQVEDRVVAEELPDEGPLRYRRIARVHFELDGQPRQLSLFWIEGYGGGLFLPFRDATCGQATYGGGRYLYDGIKGADLGAMPDRLPLDFNYAYNPSCAYSDHWVCPLAPRENWLPAAIPAGEKRFQG